MDVTVAICTWNRADLLNQTLQQLATACVPATIAWELVVVDNNCTDHTQQVLAEHKDKLPLTVVTESKPGLSHARNLAIQVSRGEVIIWIDDDVLVDEHWLTESLAAIRDTDAGICFGSVHPWWETKPPKWFDDCLAGRFALYDRGPQQEILHDSGSCGYGANHAVARTVYDQVGAYQTDLGVVGDQGGGGEDTEFFARVMNAGITAVYAGTASVRHYIPAERCEKRYFRRRRWRGGPTQLALLARNHASGRRVMGIPAYMYRQHLRELGVFGLRSVTGPRGRAFQSELRLIGFASLLKCAIAGVWLGKAAIGKAPIQKAIKSEGS